MRPRPDLHLQSVSLFLLRPLVGPLLLLLAVAGAVVWGIDRNARQIEVLNAAQVRLNLINLLSRDVIDMETGLRGYLLTGEGSYLDPYRKGRAHFRERLGTLRRLSVNEVQRANLRRVETTLARWEASVAGPSLAARRGAAAEPPNGKQLIDEARAQLATLERNEMRRREAAAAASLAALQLVRTVTIAGLLIAVLLLFYAAQRAARTLTQGLHSLNDGAARIAQGDYDPAPLDVPIREVQALRGQFHSMAAAVEQREQKLKAAQQVLEETNRDLERSNRELEQFAYVASHDLQEPLRTIGSYTALLSRRYEGQLDERADQYIRFTLSATHRLKGLIQDLLLYSRVRQQGKVAEQFSAQRLVDEVLGDFQDLIRRSGAHVSVDELPPVWGNPELLRHVFQNLIGNALKFLDPQRPGEISVSALKLPHAWKFSVQDNGIGIEAAYFERIFGVFQRLHGIGTFEGSGIGLAVVKNVVERHGGAMQVESTLGQGSTFSFTLPHPHPPERAASAAALVPSPDTPQGSA
ncbi:histidine kinase [Deinococcus irradiatisoli]|uniref:histidine kinase n=1 Tax=Deinococcus irradiatisoli TaxID=2202254 RepID=A0A2Z3JLM9_9DEIO|nr:sensor histidine kinase [Deinococcus irradiatisoli]AWN22688.1 histidine kinase [Deinococcus irradiatisoli]